MSKVDKLPDGWVICESKSTPGRKYFFNKKTGKSSWSQPQDGDKHGINKKKGKKEKMVQHYKSQSSNISKKLLKRKSDGIVEENMSAKQSKQSRDAETKPRLEHKKTFCNNEEKRTPEKISPIKNQANSRLQKFRASLNAEVAKEESFNSTEESPRKSLKHKISTPVSHTEVPSKTSKLELKSPSTNDTKCLTVNQSPCSDSLQSTPSPSQFFAANKILYAMKAQLPEEYTCKVKQKDAFADIEEGICNQISEYPTMKHPATPPQFSEASKLVSAIKSKLSYNFKNGDVKKFTSAKDRMEALRASLNNESIDSQNSSGNSLNNSKNLSSDEVMDIDCKQWKPTQIICLNHSKSLETHSKEDVVLVVDTNIFIHELDFIKNVLNSHIKGYNVQPTLLIPWRVINELDRLKDNNNGNGAICKRARSAMDYLYKLLPENSRIKGQSLRDANCHIYPCESPDDEILNCCLQQKERQKVVILLSNDKNLCNKAVTNDVKCKDLEQLKGMLESKPQPINPELFSNVEHYKDTIYQLLSNILENEMRATYNNLWQHVLFKAPPWTLCDVLQCLLKHWIAVFNDVFPRIEHLITDLKNTLSSIQSKDPKTLSASEVTNFKELCLDVAKRCQIIPEYMQLAKITVDRLERKSTSENESSCERDSEILVINAFEGVWTVFSSYCAKLCLGLGIPHNIEDKLSTDDPLKVLIDRCPVFSNQINTLALALQGVLSIENDGDPVVNERFDLLETAFKESLALIYMDSSQINSDNLRIFCIKCRNMLQEAYTKFSQLIELLNLCKEKIGK